MASKRKRKTPVETPQTRQVVVRLPHELLAEVEALAVELQAATPHAKVSKSDAIRTLLGEALSARKGASADHR